MPTIPPLLRGLSDRLADVVDGHVRVLDPVAARELSAHDGEQRVPSLVVAPRDAGQVARALPLLADAGLPIVARGGGHGFDRAVMQGGGVVLDLRRLDDIAIDARARVATAGGGVLAGAYTAAAARHGLTTGFGDTTSVGIAGLTLGGGIGFLSRLVGLAADELVGADLVTLDGRVHRVDAEHEPELLWALRGGGPGLGVVTSLRYRLHEVAEVTGGALLFEPDPALLAALVDAGADAEDELSIMVNVMPAPPAPFVPERLHGRTIVAAIGAHAGDAAAAARAFDRLRALAPVLVDTVRRQPYAALLRGEEPAAVPVVDSGFLDGLDVRCSEHAIASVTAMQGTGLVNVRPMGGAIGRVASDATAFAHRSRRAMAIVASRHPDEHAASAARASVRALVGALADGDATYRNFGSERAGIDERAYPAPALSRIEALRAAHDPAGLLTPR